MSLVVTFAPRHDESGFGYYRRLAAENIYDSWRDLARMAGMQLHRGALLGHADFVAGQLGLELEWAQMACQQEATSRSWRRFQRAHVDAVCPACLVEGSYLRHHWEHSYAVACPSHHIRLVDHCDDCGEPLSPHRYHIGRCDCGHDLTRLPRVASTPAQHWLATLIASGGTNSGEIEPSLCVIDLNTLTQIVRVLCVHADPLHPVPGRSAGIPKSVNEAVAFLAPLETLLSSWPAGFRTHVSARIAVGKREARTLNTLLGSWYISLRKLCQGSAFESVLTNIIEVAATQFDGVLGLDSAKAVAMAVTECQRAPDAAKVIGVSVSRLHKAIEAGECIARKRRVGTRGEVYEIPNDEVKRIQQHRSAWCASDEACELAGITPAVLEHMMAAEVIRSDINWRQDLLKAGPIERDSIHTLIERIQTLGGGEVPEADTLRWAELNSRRMGDKQAIRALMRAIAEGKVKAVAKAHRLGEWRFRRQDVAAYFGTPLLEAGMSIQQLSKLTGWKWESIAHWLEEGLLESQTIMLRGQNCRVVMPQQLLAFRQSYLPLADLARGVGSKSSALAKLLPGLELVGAKQLSDGASRGGLVRIADLCRLAVLGARAG